MTAGSDPADPADAVERAVVRLRRSIGRRALGRALVDELGGDVDLGVLEVLDAVDEGPEPPDDVVSVGLLARRAGLDPSRASRRATAAVAGGWLRRVASQGDARRVGLELTDAGAAVVERVRARRREHLAAAMQDWPDRDREEFARLITRFTGG